MKVTVSALSRRGPLHLAEQLERRNHLQRLITALPRSDVSAHGIPRRRTATMLLHEIAQRLWGEAVGESLQRCEAFDRDVARRIPDDTDVFVGWPGTSLTSLVRAGKLGALAVLVHDTGHVDAQNELLREEYRRHRAETNGPIPQPLPSPEAVERTIEEYEQADCILVPSSSVRDSFVERGVGAEKLIVSPPAMSDASNGASRIGRAEAMGRWRGDGSGPFRILFMGELSLRSGVRHLVRAVAELQLPDTELWLVGSVRPEIEPYLDLYAGNFEHFEDLAAARLRLTGEDRGGSDEDRGASGTDRGASGEDRGASGEDRGGSGTDRRGSGSRGSGEDRRGYGSEGREDPAARSSTGRPPWSPGAPPAPTPGASGAAANGSGTETASAALLRSASALVMPALEIGMPTVQLEAMAAGLPLVGTTAAGAADLVRDGYEGFVVPPADSEAIKERLAWLYANPDACRAMGAAARDRVLEGYSWFDYGDRAVEHFRRMLALESLEAPFRAAEGVTCDRPAFA